MTLDGMSPSDSTWGHKWMYYDTANDADGRAYQALREYPLSAEYGKDE